MIELARTVRFCLNGPESRQAAPRHNNFSAWPPMRGLGRYYQAHITCAGHVDPVTGYFINIKAIDDAFRRCALPYLNDLVAASSATADLPMGTLMDQLLVRLQTPLGGAVEQVRLDLTPFLSLEIRSDDMAHIIMRQQYEFAAAHRLHCPELSDEKNREVFGKCNNPSGHGHNYRLEVAIRVPIRPDGQVVRPEALDAIVDTRVIEKLDHKNLSIDVPEFASRNSSVENIAQVVYGMLETPLAESLKAELVEVRVWETSKTVCTYRGEKPEPAVAPRRGEER